MHSNRRDFLKLATAASAALATPWTLTGQRGSQRPAPPVSRAAYKRIAAEEAWGTAELFAAWKKVLESKPADEPGFAALWRNLDPAGNSGFTPRLTDLGPGRIADLLRRQEKVLPDQRGARVPPLNRWRRRSYKTHGVFVLAFNG